MRDIIREEARLIILRELHRQPNFALKDAYLQAELELEGIRKSVEWVRDEIRYLESVGAVSLPAIEGILIPVLTPKGIEHLEQRLIIEGVKRPTSS